MRAYQRQYFYEVDISGRLFHDESELQDHRFLKFFFQRLEANHTGEHPQYGWLSRCGPELNFVRAAITPIVFDRLRQNDATRAGDWLYYNGCDLSLPFEPAALFASPDGGLWHPAPEGCGAPWGRLHTRLLYELADQLSEFDGPVSHADGRPTGTRLAIEPPLGPRPGSALASGPNYLLTYSSRKFLVQTHALSPLYPQ